MKKYTKALHHARPFLYVGRPATGKRISNHPTHQMNGDDLFLSLEDQTFFVDYVKEHFANAPAQAGDLFPCKNTVSTPRVTLAYAKYTSSLQTYKLLLDSENPDHYKRSGALLHSLYKTRIVTKVEFEASEFGTLEQVDNDHVIGLSYDDCQYYVKYPKFYSIFYNEILSFDIAYQCCAAYEDNPTGYSINFLENAVHYLHSNDDLHKDSLSMMFRALMLPKN